MMRDGRSHLKGLQIAAEFRNSLDGRGAGRGGTHASVEKLKFFRDVFLSYTDPH